MTIKPGTIERAFQLARSGEFSNIDAIKQQLRKELYADANVQFDGSTIRRQLAEIIRKAGAGAGEDLTPPIER